MKTKKKVVMDFDLDSIKDYVVKEDTHFLCVTQAVSDFKDNFETMKEALKNTTIKFIKPTDDAQDSGGMVINAFDRRTGALIKNKIFCSAFDEFYIEANEYSIGIDMKKFAGTIKQATNNDVIVMFVHKDKTDELSFVFWNPKDIYDKNSLKLMNIQEDVITIPDSKFDCMITMKTEDFHTYIRNSSSKTEDITISFIDTKERPNNIEFSDPKSNTKRLLTDKSVGVSIEKTNPEGTETIIRNTYKIKNLIIFCKMKTTYVSLFLTNKYPLIVNYNIEDFCYLVLILPPSETETDKLANVDDDDEEDIPDDNIRNLCLEEENNDDEDEDEEEEYV